jgi:hypothetical protein
MAELIDNAGTLFTVAGDTFIRAIRQDIHLSQINRRPCPPNRQNDKRHPQDNDHDYQSDN